MNAKIAGVFAFLCLGSSGVSWASVRHVPGDHPTIQACLDAASFGIDMCVVEPGVYHETIDFLGKVVVLRSSGGPEVTIIDGSGFNDTVVRCENDEGPATILEGFTITGGVGVKFDEYQDFRRGGGMYNDETSPTVIHCIFSGNSAVGSSGAGGGMYNRGGHPTIFNCSFLNNESQSGAGIYNHFSEALVANCVFSENAASHGGGGLANSGGHPTILDCAFRNNTATVCGGGMIADGFGLIRGCVFERNHADTYGGGLLTPGGSMTVLDSTFVENTSKLGGGAAFKSGFSIVEGCEFVRNEAADLGGGIYHVRSAITIGDTSFSENVADIGGGVYSSGFGFVLNGSTFQFNEARRGGGLSVYDGLVSECRFEGNTAIEEGGGLEGGGEIVDCSFVGNRAYLNGAGVAFTSRQGGSLDRCVFRSNNAANSGAGLYISDGSPIVSNCLFSRNFVARKGGAIGSASAGNSSLINCTFSANRGRISVGGVFHSGSGALAIVNSIFWNNTPDEIATEDVPGSTVSVAFGNIKSGLPANVVDAGGNMDVDPMFVDADGADGIPGTDDDDFRLLSGSLCIDAGDNTAVPLGVLLDLAGLHRFADDPNSPDTGNPDGLYPIVDVGAYERPGPASPPGDFDNDGDVDVVDHKFLVECLNGPDESPQPAPPVIASQCVAVFDRDGDLDVDLYDYAQFAPE